MSFRFTLWLPHHNWNRWLAWFKSIGVKAWIESRGDRTAVFREGKEAR